MRAARCYVHTDIAVPSLERRPRMHPHPHPDRALSKRRASVGRSPERPGCGRKRNEARISLRVHLDTAMLCEDPAHHTPMLLQRLRIALGTKFVQQPRRPLDIREQERHRAGWQIVTHGASINPSAGENNRSSSASG